MYFTEIWNICDAIAVILFFIGFVIRIQEHYVLYGRIFYCVGVIFWYIRILEIFGVNKYLGPYVMMIGKMVSELELLLIVPCCEERVY